MEANIMGKDEAQASGGGQSDSGQSAASGSDAGSGIEEESEQGLDQAEPSQRRMPKVEDQGAEDELGKEGRYQRSKCRLCDST